MADNPYDWPALKTEYVTGNLSIRRIAERHGLNENTIKGQAYRYGWSRARAEYRACLEEKAAKKIAGLQEQALASEYKIADELSRVLRAALADAKQFRRYIVSEREEGENRVVEKVFEKVDMRALNEAARTLKTVEDVKRSLKGVLTACEERKLALEERRLALAEKQAGKTEREDALFAVADPFTEGETDDGDPR